MRFLNINILLVGGFLLSASVTGQNAINNSYYEPLSDRAIYSEDNNLIYGGFGQGGYYPYKGIRYLEEPNLTLIYERIIFKHVGPGTLNLGPIFSYKKISSRYIDFYSGYTYIQNWNYYFLGARISYHLNIFSSKTVDTYAGAMFGYYITNFKFLSNDPNYANPADPGFYLTSGNYPNFFAESIFAGVRSSISYHTSVWLELGYGYTSIALGVCYKF